MKLTNIQCKSLKPQDKVRRYFDGHGLFLEVHPGGGKYWRHKYKFEGRERRRSLGVYPEVTLKEAREAVRKGRKKLRKGIDPVAHAKAKAEARADKKNTFERVAREWHDVKMRDNAEAYRVRVLRNLETNIFPWLGDEQIREITAPQLLKVLQRRQDEVTETMHRALRLCGQIFRYAIATGRAERDIAADLRGALPSISKKTFPAITEPDELKPVLQTMYSYQGSPQVQAALKLQPLLACRPGELRQMLWCDVDLDAAEWRFTLSKTAGKHVVPLSTQAVEILRELQPQTSHSKYVFPTTRNDKRCLSDNAVLAALRQMELPKDKVTGHGFRATFRTVGDEVLGFRPDLLEHQLGHAVRDANGRSYNRTSFLPQRTELMQQWSDYLYTLAKL